VPPKVAYFGRYHYTPPAARGEVRLPTGARPGFGPRWSPICAGGEAVEGALARLVRMAKHLQAFALVAPRRFAHEGVLTFLAD